MTRVRVVEGSCWPCKKRRIKCDLTRPVCHRCLKNGSTCDYNTRLIRWSTRPSVRVMPIIHQVSGFNQDGLSIAEKRALDYFRGRVWPLLQTLAEPCAPPLPVAITHRVVLLATCMLANSHRVLQDGKESRGSGFNVIRLECLAAIRSEVGDCCSGGSTEPLLVLLFAVLLFYLHDGFMELNDDAASTLSHHQGVLAILEQLGGIEPVLLTSQQSLQMLLSEFVSADLTTALLQGTPPSYSPTVWEAIDQGAVWWERDPLGRYSLATVFREMSTMAFYLDSLKNSCCNLSMEAIRAFEENLRPIYAPITTPITDDGSDSGSETTLMRSLNGTTVEVVHAFSLIRIFQHTALVYLYRAICGLPLTHPLVQQHVQSCLDCILDIERPSKTLHCVIFPLYVVGAHAQLLTHRQAVLDLMDFIYENMRFACVRAIGQAVRAIWDLNSIDLSWAELFSVLSPNVLVL